uniref:Inward rectifier potassium channel C-terminal domain-containing protein n=1 Tax=Phlebotomus papatasi TaxID=29031 RepID=A0A1B0DD19_PHLPP
MSCVVEAAVDSLEGENRNLLPSSEFKCKKPIPFNKEASLSPINHIYSTLRTPDGTVLRRCHFRLGDFKATKKRFVFKNGNCNVTFSHIQRRKEKFLRDIFTTLVESNWRWTLFIFSMSFICSWMGFATTIGYGVRTTTEECPEAIFLMCLQSIYGVMTQAFMVGVAFAKMAYRGNCSHILQFSKFAVISQREGDLCLMFRVGDTRQSRMTGVNIRARLIHTRTTAEGEKLEHFQEELKVQIDECNPSDVFLVWPAIVFHRIDCTSPLYNLSPTSLMQDNFEIIILFEATIESTGLSTQTRTSFLNREILWGHRFDSILFYNRDYQCYDVDYSRFNETFEVETPLCSAKDIDNFLSL